MVTKNGTQIENKGRESIFLMAFILVETDHYSVCICDQIQQKEHLVYFEKVFAISNRI